MMQYFSNDYNGHVLNFNLIYYRQGIFTKNFLMIDILHHVVFLIWTTVTCFLQEKNYRDLSLKIWNFFLINTIFNCVVKLLCITKYIFTWFLT